MGETPSSADASGSVVERARLLLAAHRAEGQSGPAHCLGDLCEELSSSVGTTGAAAVLRSSNGGEAVVASTNPATRTRAELEFDVGEGPGCEAFWTGRPVLVPDLADTSAARWPGFAEVAARAGVGAVFAFPMQLGATRFGVLLAIDDVSRPLVSAQVTLALAVADVATEVMLQGAEQVLGPDDDDLGLLTDLSFRAEVFQAQGALAASLGVSLPEALARLRARAFVSGSDLASVAQDVLAGRLDLSDDHKAGET